MSVLFFLAAAMVPGSLQAGRIENVAAEGNAVTIKFDDNVAEAKLFSLTGPERIAVDISGATIAAGAPMAAEFGSIRQAQFSPETARLVFDLNDPAVVSDARFSADGRSLTIALRPATESEFSAASARMPRRIAPIAQFRSEPPKRRYEVSAPIGKGNARGLPKISGPADSRLPLVVVDAGHGGHDPGAISPDNGAREKDVTLAIARAIRDELTKSGRVRVALTRDGDRFLVLQDRYGIARRMNADLFISIHADAAENREARGGTVYTLSEVASDREAQRLAARENKADIINGVNLGGQDNEVSSILIDLTQRETMNVSAGFAKLLLREARPNMLLRGTSHRFASFVVLKAPDTPSVLFETGYISNAEDAAFLASRDGQQKVARSVSNAIQAHFARRLAQN
ncbi:MAG: N-acetylmuramoyl-L-alanine amidase [Sphingorhabdus sp.]|nr:N-acetylmuramoyl-L-alanine amidase [Sphingorhabdus sp.]